MPKTKNVTKRMVFFVIVVCILLPVMIWGANFLLRDSSYWVISAVLLVLPMVAFVLHWEWRSPQPAEIALLAVLTAITIVANLMSITMIPFQAGTAMVILCGIGFGPEMGCFVGMLARFGVNFFYGQGAWTPWQMAGWGLMGLLAGLLFYQKIRISLPPKRIPMTLFGFFATVIFYGGIVNLSTVIFSGILSQFSWSAVFAVYLAGIPYDMLHGLGTAFFLACFGSLLYRAMRRVKEKYGFFLMESEN